MFLVMELCDQGELCDLLRVRKTLNENVSTIFLFGTKTYSHAGADLASSARRGASFLQGGA